MDGALDNKGNVTVRCGFARNAQGVAFVSGEAHAQVSLTCQRCLEPVQVSLDIDFRLALVGEEEEAEKLSDDEDYLVVGYETVSLQDIVEDELILALPLVATHEDCDAVSFVQEALPVEVAPKKENPFQMLADLKGQDSEKK